MYIFTRLTQSKDVIELIKLMDKLCIPKPAEFNLSDIRKRFNAMNEIQSIPREEYFKEKSSRNKRINARTVVAELCIGLVNNKFDLKGKEEREQIYKDLCLILFSWRTIGIRMRRHIISISKVCCDWLTEKEIEELEEKDKDSEMEDELDHDYDTDEEVNYMIEEKSSESDDSDVASDHTVNNSSAEDDDDDYY